MNVPETPAGEAAEPAAIGWHTIAMLCVGYATAAVDGTQQGIGDPGAGAGLLTALIGNLNLALWAATDARRRRRPIPLNSQTWFFVFAWLLVPGYAIQSRGLRGFGWVVAHGAGWFATLAATYYLADSLTLRRGSP